MNKPIIHQRAVAEPPVQRFEVEPHWRQVARRPRRVALILHNVWAVASWVIVFGGIAFGVWAFVDTESARQMINRLF